MLILKRLTVIALVKAFFNICFRISIRLFITFQNKFLRQLDYQNFPSLREIALQEIKLGLKGLPGVQHYTLED